LKLKEDKKLLGDLKKAIMASIAQEEAKVV
jgi:hypothetical protein